MFFCLFCPPQKQVVNHHKDDGSNSIMSHNRNNNLLVVETQTNHQHQQHKHQNGFINGEKKANKHARVSSLTPTINTMATTPTASSLSWATKQQGGGGGEISSLTSPTHSRTRQTIIRTVDTFDSVLTEEEEPLAGESIHHHHHNHDQDQGSLTLTTYEKLETYLENLHEDTCLNEESSHRGMMNNDETTPKSFLLPSPQSDTGSILVLTTDSKWFPPHQPQTRETQEQEQESSSPMIVQKDPHPTNRIRSASAAWSSSSSASGDGSSSSTGVCNRDSREDRRDRIEHELSVIVQACVDNKEFVHEFEDEAIEALGIAAMKVAYVDDGEGLSIAYCILYGRLLEVASRHYFGKFDDFIVAYSPVLRSSIQRLKNNLVTDAKYYDNNYAYVRSTDNSVMSSGSSQFRSTTTSELVFRDHSNFWDSP